MIYKVQYKSQLLLVAVIFLCASFSYFPSNSKDSFGWNLSKDEDGIKVYTQQKEGDDLKAYKAEMILSCSVFALEKILDKVEKYEDWQENMTSSTILKRVGDNNVYAYFTTDIPWPISDRDIITHNFKKKRPDGVITYNIEGEEDYIERKEGFVRIVNSKGMWQIVPRKDGKIKVINSFYGDPGGSIPAWIINLFIVDGPHQSMINLRELVKGN